MKKVTWRLKKKKKRAWHRETEVELFYKKKKILVLKPFFAVDILQVFNINCIWSCFVFEKNDNY